MNNMNDPLFKGSCAATLSPAGQVRQQQILRAMQRAGSARKRRRHIAQSAALALPLFAAAAAWLRPAPMPPPRTIADAPRPTEHNTSAPILTAETPAPPPIPAPPAPILIYSEIHTDADILQRCTIANSAPTIVQFISDRELSSELARAGLDPGIVRTPTEVYSLAFNDLASATRGR